MRRILFAAFAVFTLAACGGGEPEVPVTPEVPEAPETPEDPGEQSDPQTLVLKSSNQIVVYADEVESVNKVLFMAKDAWVASIETDDGARSAETDWLKLTSGGEKKHEGEAGDISLTVKILPNNTEFDRSATIEITSGDSESVEITISQDSRTIAQAAVIYGETDSTTCVPTAEKRLVERMKGKIGYASYNNVEFEYDDKGRIIAYQDANWTGVELAYLNNRVFLYGRNNRNDYSEIEIGEDGYAKRMTTKTGAVHELSHTSGMFSTYVWHAGEMTGYGNSYGINYEFTIGTEENKSNVNIDLNALFTTAFYASSPEESVLSALGLLGKRGAHMAKSMSNNIGETAQWKYKSANGYVTEVEYVSNFGFSYCYEITYR